jgi:hypothetical protein
MALVKATGAEKLADSDFSRTGEGFARKIAAAIFPNSVASLGSCHCNYIL